MIKTKNWPACEGRKGQSLGNPGNLIGPFMGSMLLTTSLRVLLGISCIQPRPVETDTNYGSFETSNSLLSAKRGQILTVARTKVSLANLQNWQEKHSDSVNRREESWGSSQEGLSYGETNTNSFFVVVAFSSFSFFIVLLFLSLFFISYL